MGEKMQDNLAYEYIEEAEERREIIDGVIYDMASPTVEHQRIVGALHFSLMSYIKEKKGKCSVFVAPLDVKIKGNVYQPDVFVVCDKDKIKKDGCYDAPDFVIEVVSASTQYKDSILKRNKYRLAGVREYWMVFPEKRSVLVIFNNTDTIYSFDDKIPVGIYDGELSVELAEILG